MDEQKTCPFEHIRLNPPEIKFDKGVYSFEQKVYAECINVEERAVVAAVVRAAKEAGFTEMFLLDRKFVLDALTEAVKKWRADT